MSHMVRVVCCLGLFATGFWCGQTEVISTSELQAQQQADAARQGASKDTLRKIRVAHDAIADAQSSLENEQLYVPAIAGPNSFAVMVGGVNAVQESIRKRLWACILVSRRKKSPRNSITMMKAASRTMDDSFVSIRSRACVS